MISVILYIYLSIYLYKIYIQLFTLVFLLILFALPSRKIEGKEKTRKRRKNQNTFFFSRKNKKLKVGVIAILTSLQHQIKTGKITFLSTFHFFWILRKEC